MNVFVLAASSSDNISWPEAVVLVAFIAFFAILIWAMALNPSTCFHRSEHAARRRFEEQDREGGEHVDDSNAELVAEARRFERIGLDGPHRIVSRLADALERMLREKAPGSEEPAS